MRLGLIFYFIVIGVLAQGGEKSHEFKGGLEGSHTLVQESYEVFEQKLVLMEALMLAEQQLIEKDLNTAKEKARYLEGIRRTLKLQDGIEPLCNTINSPSLFRKTLSKAIQEERAQSKGTDRVNSQESVEKTPYDSVKKNKVIVNIKE